MIAKRLNGKRTPGSGNKWHSKGDVITDKFLVEAKATFSRSIPLKADVWEKIRHEALSKGKLPMMSLQLATSFNGKHELVVLEMHDFIEMYNRLPQE